MKFWKVLFLAFTGIFVYACKNGKTAMVSTAMAVSPPPADTPKVYTGMLYYRLDTYFMNQFLYHHFNGNVLVAKGGRIIYQGCFGYKCYANKDTLTAQTPFHLASTSKPFTAAAILRLAEEGKLSLSDSLGKFFPGIPYRTVTIEQLLSHRSGLPNYLYFGEKLWRDRTRYMSNDDLVNLLIKNKAIEGTSRPGTHFQYCNTNFALLASIVERVSGKPFPQYMSETFFQPLGMKNTFVRDVRRADESARAALSYNSKWMLQKDDPYDGVYGDKNLFSSIEDLLLWDNAFYRHENISATSEANAIQPRSFEHRGYRNYGLGWRLMKQPNGEHLVYHNGWWHGNNTVYYRYLPDSFALVILSNRYNPSIYRVQPVFNLISGTRDTMAGDSGE
ncbi:MAG: serine hydrolase domain-containing protein [Chitinophagales bacterium]